MPFYKNFTSFTFLFISLLIISCADNSVAVLYINGKVVDQNGFSNGSALVSLNGTSPKQCNSDGSFAFTTDRFPYNIVIFNPVDSIVTCYAKLNSNSPVLRTQVSLPMMHINNSSQIIIKHPEFDEEKVIYTSLVSTDNPLLPGGAIVTDDSTISINVRWPNEFSGVSGTVVMIAADTSGSEGGVIHISNYGIRPFTVTAGGNTNVIFSQADLSTIPNQGPIYVASPPNYISVQFGASISFEGSYTYGIPLVSKNSFTGGNILIPLYLSIPFNITLQANDNSYRHSCVNTFHIGNQPSLSFGTDVNLMTPDDGAAGVGEQTKFSYDAGYTKGFYSAMIFDINSPGSLKIQMYSTDSYFWLPSLNLFGISLSYGKLYTWDVTKLEGYNDINDFVSVISLKSRVETVMQTVSAQRTFRYGQ